MSKFLTNIKEVNINILKNLDINNLYKVCITNKDAMLLCNNLDFWVEKFSHDNIPLTYKPNTFNQWVKYYIYSRIYSNYIKFNDIVLNNINKANLYANNIMLIAESWYTNEKYKNIYFIMKSKSLLFHSIIKLKYEELEDYYPLILFKYSKTSNIYHVLLYDENFTEDNFYEDLQDFDEEDELIYTEDEFIYLLTAIIYDKQYSNIQDVNRMSYIEENLYGGEYADQRLGMWKLIHYLNKNQYHKALGPNNLSML